MRKFVAIMSVVGVAFAMSTSLASAAAAPQAKQAQAAETKQPAQTKTAAKDPNFRFHNGQWFYFLPQTKSWKVWDGTKWNNVPSNQTRTLSYDEPAVNPQFTTGFNGSYQTFGNSYSNYPYTNNRIIGSYGFRGAGSKVEGRY